MNRHTRGARHDPFESPVRDEILAGLRASPKTIAPKFFYDARGAQLFELICEQPEYYLTRAELEILGAHAHEIAHLAGPNGALLEYGSGAGTKVRLLLDALDRPASYTPIDISRQQLANVAQAIGRDYPELGVHPVCADYTRRFEVPDRPIRARRIAFFPGSTIGNFHPVEAIAFLQRIRHVVGTDGALILGVDRIKDTAVLEAAYNDANGVTAEFNLNVLTRLNRDLLAGFDLRSVRHLAFFNQTRRRVEMHLESLVDQTVPVGGENVRLEAGETIWTESSYKYDRDGLDALAEAAGFAVRSLFTDECERFWVAFLTVASNTAYV